MATTAKKTKAPAPLPQCPYGSRCYRKNPQHFLEFDHGSKKEKLDPQDSTDSTDGPSTSKKTKKLQALPSVDDSSLPPCQYGAKCYRKNLLHFAEYSHPTAVISSVTGDSDSGNDTDELEDDDESDKSKLTSVKSSDILKKGMSLVKSYTAMSEDERKELIKKAFAAKKALEEELKKTKDEMKKKDEEVERLQKEVATGLLLMEGEKEALEGDQTVYFDLFAERAYKEGSADQTHFRLAESQFYRLLSGYGAKITKVQYVINPKIDAGFKQCRESLKKVRGEEFSYPVLAFHGTQEASITPICETGFRIPGEGGFKHRTDTGWYGKGVYFSEYPAYSMGYIQGSTKLLLCQVLPGKVYNCTKLIHGASLQSGYDSHTSPDKKELVIFNKFHILPAYIVHYKSGANLGEFKYKTAATIMADDNLFDPTVLADRFNKANQKKKSKVLKSYTVQFTGNFCGTQKNMFDLAEEHGAKKGTKAVFSLLVAAKDEYDMKTSKVMQAEKKGLPIVAEMYIYDCIIQGKLLSTDKYEFQ